MLCYVTLESTKTFFFLNIAFNNCSVLISNIFKSNEILFFIRGKMIKILNPIDPNKFDYFKYKNEVEKAFQSNLKAFSLFSNRIDKEIPQKIFWEIVNGRDFCEGDIYLAMCFLIAKVINGAILILEGIMHPVVAQLETQWFNYLRYKFFDKSTWDKISDEFCENLASKWPYNDRLMSKYIEFNTDPPKILWANFYEEEDIILFWKEFKKFFENLYIIFFETCQLFGKEIARIKNLKNLDTMEKIFQLIDPPAARTPPELIFEYLKTYKHIRNANAHENKKFHLDENPQSITLWDEYKGNIKWEKKFLKEELIMYLHSLFIFYQKFEIVGLGFSIIKRLIKNDY